MINGPSWTRRSRCRTRKQKKTRASSFASAYPVQYHRFIATKRAPSLHLLSVQAKILRAQELQNFPDHVLDGEIRRVDNFRIVGDGERRIAPGRVGQIARDDLIMLALRGSALGPDFGRSVDIKLEGSLGE